MVAQPVTTAQSILSHAGEILHRHEEIARRTGRRFNLFDLLDRATDEVKGHSAFIAALLSPTGTHGQGDLFLKPFLDRLTSLAEKTWRMDEAEGDWTVRVEVALDRSRADIVLDGGKHYIVIENKIYTAEHSDQLQNYYRGAKKTGRIAGVVFLPLEPAEPSKAARDEIGDRLLATDYTQLILPWINDCIGLAARVPPVREGLIQYHRLIARLTQEPEDMDSQQEITTLLNAPERLDAAAQLAAALVKKRIDIHLRFWKAIEKALCKRLGLQAEDFHDKAHYDVDQVKGFHRKQRNRPCLFGLRFDIPGRAQWAMKVEVNWGIYFGVVVMDNGQEQDPITLEHRQQIMGELEKVEGSRFFYEKDEPHIIWKYGPGMERIKFHGPDKVLAHALADPAVFDRHVSSLVDDIVRTARVLSDEWREKQ